MPKRKTGKMERFIRAVAEITDACERGTTRAVVRYKGMTLQQAWTAMLNGRDHRYYVTQAVTKNRKPPKTKGLRCTFSSACNCKWRGKLEQEEKVPAIVRRFYAKV